MVVNSESPLKTLYEISSLPTVTFQSTEQKVSRDSNKPDILLALNTFWNIFVLLHVQNKWRVCNTFL